MMLSNWLANDKPITWKLLYNPSKGQDTLKDCFDIFYNIPSIVVLIETVKGCKLGGYTSVGWDSPPHDGSGNIILLTIHSQI